MSKVVGSWVIKIYGNTGLWNNKEINCSELKEPCGVRDQELCGLGMVTLI